MDLFENRTFDEIKVGDAATLERHRASDHPRKDENTDLD
jgi:hypothetical protein